MSFISRTSIPETENVSVEDFGVDPSPTFFDEYFLGLNAIPSSENDFDDFQIDGECNQDDLLASINCLNETNDLNVVVGEQTENLPTTIFNGAPSFAEILPIPSTTSSKQRSSKENSIQLSGSVGVGQTQPIQRVSHNISLVNPLEETYRPRYKSDYFAQNGKTRKPRYVADRKGNHFITLKVPKNVFGCIRIDWITVETEDGDVYSMPYRFQASNDKSQIPDQNPLFIPIEADAHGCMKIYLVLIKSKQDDLKNLQPLKPFAPLKEAFGKSTNFVQENSTRLMPKQLIQKFQLDKSQLAFTFCSLSQDGNSWIPEWNTMVCSTVMTEISPETNRQKTVSCPNCRFSFPFVIPADDDETTSEETTSKKRKRSQKTSTKKQRSSTATDFFTSLE